MDGPFAGSAPLPSEPRATFTFTYQPNLPLVRVDVQWRQKREFDYDLVRLFQWGGRPKRFQTYLTRRRRPTDQALHDRLAHGLGQRRRLDGRVQ